ncbi:MAG: DNA primase [Acidimicrobiales bacterium]|nr:DNA primase [Acidimicrobiales bacterium]
MGILDEDVVRVREAADIVAVISAYTQLRGSGRHWSGLCPFHGEKTPSFSVNPEKGVYYCFGCQAKGDAITFVRDIEHLDFQGAVELLAAKFGITLRYTDRNEGERRDARRKLQEALVAAVDWYHDRLMTSPDAGAARRYLRSRGLDRDEVVRYRIGWAPDDWDQLSRALKFPAKTLRDAGLGRESPRGGTNDFFRNRVLFPIFDAGGQPLGFGGRILPGAPPRRDGRPQAKYQNTPETSLYRKSKVLYGLNWAKDEAVRTNEIIICEGYTDVIGFAHVGLDRAVATCGTALTDDHVNTLKRFAPRLVLAFDPDAAGQAAAERVYEWEKKHEVEVAVADLPAGEDPADLSRRDPDRLRAAVEAAVPFLGFRVERILRAADLSSPESRARAAEKALDAIAEHPNEFVRDPYVIDVATRCRIDVDRLRSAVRSGKARVTPQRRRPVARRRADTAATEALRLAVAVPDEVLPLLAPVLFDQPQDRAAYVALEASGGDLHAATAAADPLVAELLTRLAVEPSSAEAGDVRRLLLRDAAQRVLSGLQRSSRTSDDFAGYAAVIGWLKGEIEAIGPDSVPDEERENELLLWLTARAEERHE